MYRCLSVRTAKTPRGEAPSESSRLSWYGGRCRDEMAEGVRRAGCAADHRAAVDIAVEVAADGGEEAVEGGDLRQRAAFLRLVRAVICLDAEQARRDHLAECDFQIGDTEGMGEHRHAARRADEAHRLDGRQPLPLDVRGATPPQVAVEG